MVDEYPDRIDSQADYSDWVTMLAQNVMQSLTSESTEDISELSESQIESAVKQEVNAKIHALRETHTPKDILRLSGTLQGTFIQGKMRDAEDTDEQAAQMARVALYESVLELVQFEVDRISN